VLFILAGKVDIKVEEACNNVSEAKLRYDFFDLENMEDLNDVSNDLNIEWSTVHLASFLKI